MVSIIVPVYNSEKALQRCVESILCQTYQDIELILVDDGSTDSSALLCDKYTQHNVKVLHKKNGGISSARNAGIELATGEWITFCDNDDIVSPHWIERLVTAVEHHKGALPVCAFTRKDSNLDLKCKIEGVDTEKSYSINDYLFFYERGLAGFVWNALYSSAVIKTYNIRFCERKEQGDINEDLIFQLDYLRHISKLTYTGHYDYLWQINETNHSSETTERWYFEKYREKYLLLRRFIKEKELEYEQSKCLATMILYHHVFAICNSKNYSLLKRRVCDEAVQHCVWHADCSNENEQIIQCIKHKRTIRLFLILWLAKIKNRMM